MGDIGTVQARYEVLGETGLSDVVQTPDPAVDEVEQPADDGRVPAPSEAER